MRRILVASLLCSFALAAAAATPKPNLQSAAPVLAASHPISTGVRGPRLLSPATVYIMAGRALTGYPSSMQMRLRVSLNAAGNTTGIQILQPLSPQVDAYVVQAVRSFRWRPAELDHQHIPVSVNLIVNVQH